MKIGSGPGVPDTNTGEADGGEGSSSSKEHEERQHVKRLSDFAMTRGRLQQNLNTNESVVVKEEPVDFDMLAYGDVEDD
jgi:hypothetical protein